MAHLKGQHPGTTWHKTDLQCHTPRDLGWIGPSHLPGGTAADEAARDAWAAAFIAECVARGIAAVAITDHHDFAFAPYIQRAGLASDPPVIVHPGIEITCSDDAQCLAVFDPACDSAVLLKLLGKLPGVMPADVTAAKTCPIHPTNWTVKEVFAAVADEEHLRDVCIIFPHFSDGNAYKHLNKQGYHTRFAELNCDGVYTEKPFVELEAATLDKAYGKIGAWGERRRAIVATGDSRSDTWDKLGLHDCYIKLGEPSIEAVRQALLADEAGIVYARPEVPTERIVEVRFKSTLTGDAPVTITFNAGFNAFIGGRGSGKSALLEYLRFGLARTEKDLGHGSAAGREREEELIEHTLVGGYVEVVLEREGVRETWTRDLHSDAISVLQANAATLSLTFSDARRRFRARAFFQKQLSSTTRSATTTTDEITGIAAAETLDRRREIDLAIDNTKRDIATAIQRLAAHWQISLERDQARARVDDLKKRIQNITERLRGEGVSAAHLAIIADAPRYTRGRNYLVQVHKHIESERRRLTGLLSTILQIPMDQFADVDTFPELAELKATVDETRLGIMAEIDKTIELLSKLLASYGQALAAFTARDTQFTTDHDAAIVQQQAHKSLLDENTRLGQELAAAEARELQLASDHATSHAAVQDFADVHVRLERLLGERRRVLSDAADQVVDKSSGLLKARLKRDPVPGAYVKAIYGLMDAAHVPDAENRCTTWIKEAIAGDQESAWTKICASLTRIYEAKIAAGKPAEPTEHIVELIRAFLTLEGNITARQIARIYANLDDTTVGAVLSATPNDYIVMTYVDEGRDIAFSQASPGQQASALLELLLRQSAGTLIIDQPEDDLDNRVIMRIVQLIRTSKNYRQLIFATHNPNIVVNGDADKVIALRSGKPPVGPATDTPRVQLFEDGAIETSAVRDAITRIMEGGREAFDLRSRKYRFDAVR